MPPEISGTQDNRPTTTAGGNDLTLSKNTAERGPLTPDDIVGLTDEERQTEEIKQACDHFNKKFIDHDPAVVRVAIKKADAEITLDDLRDIDHLENAVVLCLEPKSAGSVNTETKTTSETGEKAETLEARKARLGKFVETHFADVCPPEHRNAVTDECQVFEDDLRVALGDKAAVLEATDAADKTLREKVIAAIPKIEANDETIAARTAERTALLNTERKIEKEIPTAETQRAKLETQNPTIPKDETGRLAMLKIETNRTQDLTKRRDQSKTNLNTELERESEKVKDLSTIKELQANFNELRSEKGTIGALKSLLGPDGVKSPEMKAIVQQVLGTATALVKALPGKSAVINRILDQSNINLGASSPIQIFAGFLAEADKSNDLTEEDKAQIRKVLHKQIDIKSGADMKEALKQGRGVKTTTYADGNTTTEPIPYDKDHPSEIQDGQYLYTDEQGKSVLRVEVDSGKSFEFVLPENSEADMGKVGIIGQVMDNMADYNLANPIYQRGLTLQAGGRIELNFPKDWVTTQNVLGIFFDKTAGWDSGLLTANDTQMMKHLMQGNAAKGDATRADADDTTATQDFTTQGILDKNGDVDWARFQKVVNHNRDQLGHGQIDFKDGIEEA